MSARPASGGGPSPRLSFARLAALGAFWFATGAQFAALTFVLVPLQALALVGDARKGTAVGAIVLGGALVSLVAAPLFGAWSDRTRTRLGRRVPFLLGGAGIAALGLLAMSHPGRPGGVFSLSGYVLAFVVVQLGYNLANAPYTALVPDLVAPAQRGAASAWLMMMNTVGAAAGAASGLVVGRLGTAAIFRLLAALLVACAALSAWAARAATPAPPPPSETRRSFWRELRAPFSGSPDFRWVFGTRFLFMMGIFTVQAFILFYLKEVVRTFALGGRALATAPEQAVSIFLGASLMGAVLTTPLGGALSDRYGRKRIVLASSALQAAVATAFLITSSFGVVLAAGALFGTGLGAYQSSDWALAADVLPSAADHGRDMGIWNVALVLPQVLATPVGGVVLDGGQRLGAGRGHPTLGYTALFGLAVAYFALSTIFVSRISDR